MKQDKKRTRIYVGDDALDRLNNLSKQFRLSRTQLVALLIETVSEQEIADALLNQTEVINDTVIRKGGI